MKWDIVAWCRGCQSYMDITHEGERCPRVNCTRILVPRLGWIDCEDPERTIYLKTEYKSIERAKDAARKLRAW